MGAKDILRMLREPSKDKKKIAELEAAVESLKSENGVLSRRAFYLATTLADISIQADAAHDKAWEREENYG
jgi:hypothetical protein